MSERGVTSFPGDVDVSDPVVQYTPSNPAVAKGEVKSFIDELQYQNDPVAAIQLSLVLRQMPDYMKEFPYLGVPLTSVSDLVNSNPVLEDASCRVVLGFKLCDSVLKTQDDVPTGTNNVVSIDVLRSILQDMETSVDRLIEDVGVFTFQYSDPGVDESNHTLLYVDDLGEYNYFVDFDDRFAVESETGGSVFQSLTPVEFTDVVADLLQLKSEMCIDAGRYGDTSEKMYRNRFVLPLITPLDAVIRDSSADEIDGKSLFER